MANITLTDRLEHGSLKINELAALVGCTTTTLRKDIASGKLQVVKSGPNRQSPVHIRGCDAKRYLEARNA